MIPSRIMNYLSVNAYHYQIVEHPRTYSALANVLRIDCLPNEMAKVIAAEVDHKNCLIIIPANEKLHVSTFKAIVQAKECRFLNEDELKESFSDCEIGAQPAFGSLYDMEVFLSDHFDDLNSIYFNAGTHDILLKIDLMHFKDVENPIISDFSLNYQAYDSYVSNYQSY